MSRPIPTLEDFNFRPLDDIARWIALDTPKKLKAFREELNSAGVTLIQVSGAWQVEWSEFQQFIELRKQIAKRELKAEENG